MVFSKRDFDNIFLWKYFIVTMTPLYCVLFKYVISNEHYYVCGTPTFYNNDLHVFFYTPPKENVQIIGNNGKCKYRIIAHLRKSILLLKNYVETLWR